MRLCVPRSRQCITSTRYGPLNSVAFQNSFPKVLLCVSCVSLGGACLLVLLHALLDCARARRVFAGGLARRRAFCACVLLLHSRCSVGMVTGDIV
jgi:hypothetical protein